MVHIRAVADEDTVQAGMIVVNTRQRAISSFSTELPAFTRSHFQITGNSLVP